MSVLAELAAYLETETLGTQGVNLFYGILPESAPDAAIVLFEYPGMPNEPVMGGRTVRLEYPSIQAMTRGVKDDYDGPMLKLRQVVESFTKIGDQTIGGVLYLSILAKHTPARLNQDENHRWRHVCSFAVTKEFSL